MRAMVPLSYETMLWMQGMMKQSPVSPEVLENLEELAPVVEFMELAAKATVLHQSEDFVAFEHPEHGDEAPVMLINLKTGDFEIESPFWDMGDVTEVRDYVREELVMGVVGPVMDLSSILQDDASAAPGP